MEYKIESCGANWAGELEDKLNRLARQGWHIFKVYPVNDPYRGQRTQVWLERETPQEQNAKPV